MRYKFRVFHAGRTCFTQSLVFLLNHSEYCVSDREQGQKQETCQETAESSRCRVQVEVPWLNTAVVETARSQILGYMEGGIDRSG